MAFLSIEEVQRGKASVESTVQPSPSEGVAKKRTYTSAEDVYNARTSTPGASEPESSTSFAVEEPPNDIDIANKYAEKPEFDPEREFLSMRQGSGADNVDVGALDLLPVHGTALNVVTALNSITPYGLYKGIKNADSIESFVTEDTHLGQTALGFVSQAIDFPVAAVRNIRGNAKKILDGTFGESLSTKIRTVMAFTPAGLVFGKYDAIDDALEQVGEIRQEIKAWLDDSSLEQGGKTGRVVGALVESTENTLYTLGLFKIIRAPYGAVPKAVKTGKLATSLGKITVAGKAAKFQKSISVMRSALVRSGTMTAIRENVSWKDAAVNFGISAAYQSTPAFSGWAKTNLGAIVVDMGANAAISTTQIGNVRSAAKNQAIAEGQPDREGMYTLIGMVQMFGSDLVFGAMTRSFGPDTPPEVRAEVAKLQKIAERTDAELPSGETAPLKVEAQLDRVLTGDVEAKPMSNAEARASIPSSFINGKASVQEVQRWMNSQNRGRWAVWTMDSTRKGIPQFEKERGAIPIPFKADGYDVYAVPLQKIGGREQKGALSENKTINMSFRDGDVPIADLKVIERATPEETAAYEKALIENELGGREQKGALSETTELVITPEERTAREAGKTPAQIPYLPSAVSIPKDEEPESIVGIRRNTERILEMMPRSAMAVDREKRQAAGKKDLSLRIEDGIEKALQKLGGSLAGKPEKAEEGIPSKEFPKVEIPITPERLDDAIDKAVKVSLPPADAKAFRNRLFRRKAATPAELDVMAAELGLESRRDIPFETLQERFPMIEKFDERQPIVQSAVRDIIKASYETDTSEKALQRYNEWSQLKGRPLLSDLKSVARGGAQVEKPAFEATPQDRAEIVQQMPKKLMETDRGRDAIDKIISTMSTPLSENPTDRAFDIRQLKKMAVAADRGSQMDRTKFAVATKRTLTNMRLLESARYAFAEEASRNGRPEIFDDYRSVDVQSRRSAVEVSKRVDEILNIAGSAQYTLLGKDRNMNMRYWLQSNPDVANAMKVLIGNDPNAKADTIEGGKVADAKKVISAIKSPHNRKAVQKLSETIDKELGTVSATNVRMLQTYRFGDVWFKEDDSGSTFGERYAALEQLGDYGRTIKQHESFGKLKAELDGVLPRWNDKGKPRVVPFGEMIEKYRVWQAGGPEALREDISKWNKGSREHYWMTEQDGEVMQLKPKTQATPGYTRKQADRKNKEAGAINHRTGTYDEKEGDLIGTLARHMDILQRQVDTYHPASRLKAGVQGLSNEGLVSKDLGKYYEMWVDSQWGKYQDPNIITKTISRGNAAFWTTYPLAWTRLLWYSGRNMLYQGAPWGPLNNHFRVGDVAAAYPEMLKTMGRGDSRVRRYRQKRQETDISNQKAIFNEQMLMADPGQLRPLSMTARIGAERMWDLGAKGIGTSDEFNRLMGSTGFVIIDKHVDRFVTARDETATTATASGERTIAGKGTYSKADVFHNTRITEMHLSQQRYLGDLFNKAALTDRHSPEWSEFIESLAEMKQVNVNFDYRIAGKSLLEQNPDARPVIGLLTYPRGTINPFYRNGIQPMLNAVKLMHSEGKLDSESMKDLARASTTIGKSVWTHAMASLVGSYLIGEKRDFGFEGPDSFNQQDPEDTKPTYSYASSLMPPSTESPGYSLIDGMRKAAFSAIYNLWQGNPEEAAKSAKWFVKRGIWMSGILPAMKKVADSVGNKQGASNIEFALGEYAKESSDAKRNMWENVLNAVFGTAQVHDDRKLMERWIDSETAIVPIAKWFMGAGDDDLPSSPQDRAKAARIEAAKRRKAGL